MKLLAKIATGLIATGFASLVALSGAAFSSAAYAQEAPDALIKRLSADLLQVAKTNKDVQSGDIKAIADIIDSKLVPHVNMSRMTSTVVGRAWRTATPEQKTKLQDEFKKYTIRTYARSMGEVKDLNITYKPFRADAADKEVVVKTEFKGKGEAVPVDYRLEKTDTGWKIYDLSVLGVWMLEAQRGQFAEEIKEKGIDGLIASLVAKNNRK